MEKSRKNAEKNSWQEKIYYLMDINEETDCTNKPISLTMREKRTATTIHCHLICDMTHSRACVGCGCAMYNVCVLYTCNILCIDWTKIEPATWNIHRCEWADRLLSHEHFFVHTYAYECMTYVPTYVYLLFCRR